jgi:hypothetical protein
MAAQQQKQATFRLERPQWAFEGFNHPNGTATYTFTLRETPVPSSLAEEDAETKAFAALTQHLTRVCTTGMEDADGQPIRGSVVLDLSEVGPKMATRLRDLQFFEATNKIEKNRAVLHRFVMVATNLVVRGIITVALATKRKEVREYTFITSKLAKAHRLAEADLLAFQQQ